MGYKGKSIDIVRIDSVNRIVSYRIPADEVESSCVMNLNYKDFVKNVVYSEQTIRIPIEYAAFLLNLLKKELWEKCESYKQLNFIFKFQSFVEENAILNGLDKEYSPVAKLNLDFINSLSIYLLWRKKCGINTDNFIFDIGVCGVNHYFSLSNALHRYFYIVFKQFNFDKNKFNIVYRTQDGKINRFDGGFDRVNGGFGTTGFPIIPITSEFYKLAQKNIFEFLFDDRELDEEDDFNRYKRRIEIIHTKVLITKETWASLPVVNNYKLLYEGKDVFIPIFVICAEIMFEIFKNLKSNDEIFNVLKDTNVLTFMMFASVYKGIYNPDGASRTRYVRKQMLSDYKTFFDIFESCNTYATGCLQLMENVLCYTRGGFFSLRALVRNSSDNDKHSYVQIKNFYKNAEREDFDFLQICISDLAEADSKNTNLIEKFMSNLYEREKEELLIEPTMEDMFWVPDLKHEPIRIKQKENRKTYYDYRAYLSDNSTISHHYGLQIFVSAILEVMGHFYVSSGNNESSVNFDSAGKYLDFCDINEIEYINMSVNPDSEYFCGTRYYVQLPIGTLTKVRKNIENVGEYIPNDLTFEAPDKTYDEIELNLDDFLLNSQIDILEEKLNDKYLELKEFVNEKISLINSTIEKLNGAVLERVRDIKDLCKVPVVLLLQSRKLINKPLRLEVLAKIIFGFSTRDYKDITGNGVVTVGVRNIVVKEFERVVDIAGFIRLFSRFYDRFGINASIKPSPQFLLLFKQKEKTLECALSGRYLGVPLYGYTQFSGGAKKDPEADILNTSLKTIGRRLITDGVNIDETRNNPHYFDGVNVESNYNVKMKRWQRDLYEVLTSDLSSRNRYGVRIKECVTHIQIKDVHIDCFYKVESLFTNAYWAGKFATELTERLKSIPEAKEKTIVLYGYERLLEPMFIKTKKLCEKESLSIKYMIYDAGYHFSAEDSAKPYISGFDSIKDDLNDCILFNVTAISVTLNTFCKMEELLYDMLGKHIAVNPIYYTVIQLYNENLATKFDFDKVVKFITKQGSTDVSLFNGTVSFNKGENKCQCNYMVAVPANWYKPSECPLCLLQTNSNRTEEYEKAIFSTDDTSLVPSFMVEPDCYDTNVIISGNESADSNDLSNNLFFINEQFEGVNNYKYKDVLFHKHVVRNGSHYQNYIRTELLIEKLSEQIKAPSLDASSELPLSILKQQFEENRKKYIEGKIYNYINVIVAPYHNSNQMFPSLINDKIFAGKAHIISFNATKTFRSNFVAEFDNYSLLLNRIKQLNGNIKASELVKFYYVDDQINTGETFTRTKSLVSELVEMSGCKLGKFDFTAVFVLIDRHSKSFRRDLIGNENMFYSVFKFLAPNLRSSGDTCPLCKQVAQDKDFMKSAALDSTASICYRRICEHRAEEISEANEKSLNVIESNPLIKTNNMRRFHTENLLYEAIKLDFAFSLKKIMGLNVKKNKKHEQLPSDVKLAALYDAICRKIKTVCKEQLYSDIGDSVIEYLISFAKSLSRPFFSYRPHVATATIRILTDIINSVKHIIVDGEECKVVFNSFSKVHYNTIEIGLPSYEVKYEKYISLLLVCISGLASLNSTYILKVDNIEMVLEILNKLLTMKEASIFDVIDNRYSSDNIRKMSYADYLRFSIFRVLHTNPYGSARRGVFKEAVLVHLDKIIGRKSDEDFAKDKLYFYTLLFLESGDINKDNDNIENERLKRIETLRRKIVEQTRNNKIEPKSLGGEREAKDIKVLLDDLFDNCFPYILKKKNNNGESWLIPLTADGYDNAFMIGYDFHYRKRVEYAPIESCYDNMQLCGRLKLVENVYKVLEKYGISFSADDSIDDIKYIFVKFNFYNYNDKERGKSSIREDCQSKEDASLYLRFDKKELLSLGKECIKNIKGVNKDNDYLSIIIALCEAVKHRSAIIEKMHDLLNTSAVDKLVAERERNSALSISKAAKHGNAKMEQIAGIASYEWLVKLAKTTLDQTSELNLTTEDVMFASIQRLLANRLLTAIYRIESTLFIEECQINMKKKELSSELTTLISEEEDNERTALEEVWYSIKNKGGFYIYGYPDFDHKIDKVLKLYFDNVDFESGNINIIVKNHNNETGEQNIVANEIKSLRDSGIARILCDCRYSSDNEFSDDSNYFIMAIMLFGYNAIRHSKAHTINNLEMKMSFVKEDGEYFVACESLTENPQIAKNSVEKANKSIAIPPWVRHNSGILENENAGITLWTLAQFFNRSWQSLNAQDIDSAIKVESKDNKFIVKIKIGFKED